MPNPIGPFTRHGRKQGKTQYISSPGNEGDIAVCSGEAVENLILAAPEMLAALWRVAYDDDRKDRFDYLVHQTAMDAVKAAIAKAEGRNEIIHRRCETCALRHDPDQLCVPVPCEHCGLTKHDIETLAVDTPDPICCETVIEEVVNA